MFKSNVKDGQEGFTYFAFGMVRYFDFTRALYYTSEQKLRAVCAIVS
jgi:hypothetical protein